MRKEYKAMLKKLLELSQQSGRILTSSNPNISRLRDVNTELKGLILSELYEKQISLTAILRKK